MPNWCSNTITITGDKKQISIIKHALESNKNKSVFETLVGREPRYTDEQYENGAWYDSNVSYWGTKWDVSYDDCQIVYDEESISLSPDTAWSPPIEFCNNLVKMYKVVVHIFYSEPGIGFCGETNIYLDEEGTLFSDDSEYGYLEGLYILDKELFWSEVDYYVDSYGEDEEEKTMEEYVEETFPFITEEDKKTIVEQIKEHHND
jgi:hypothetical protein